MFNKNSQRTGEKREKTLRNAKLVAAASRAFSVRSLPTLLVFVVIWRSRYELPATGAEIICMRACVCVCV